MFYLSIALEARVVRTQKELFPPRLYFKGRVTDGVACDRSRGYPYRSVQVEVFLFRGDERATRHAIGRLIGI